MLIEGPGLVILYVDRERAKAGNFGGGQRADHRIVQQAGAKPRAARSGRHRQPRQDHRRDRMSRHALASTPTRATHLQGSER
jgi:hypothetical protein